MARHSSTVPEGWWQFTCERSRSPFACVTSEGFFVWANVSYCELVGYSLWELQQKKWQDITVAEDIGGDEASCRELLEGTKQHFSMSKRYVHKLGDIVSVQMDVHRFPEISTFECFSVEAMPAVASQTEVERIRQQLKEREARDEAFRKEVAAMIESMKNTQNSNSEQSASPTMSVNVGGNSLIILLAVAAILLIAYFIFFDRDGIRNEPRKQNHVERTE